jgi:ribosomal protein L23
MKNTTGRAMTMSAEAVKRLMEAPRQPSKYNARKTWVDRIQFDSMAEAKRYRDLKLLQEHRKISKLEVHRKFPWVCTYEADGRVWKRSYFYEADFTYEQNGELVVEDVKGVRTKEYIRKRQIIEKLYGITIKEVNSRGLATKQKVRRNNRKTGKRT